MSEKIVAAVWKDIVFWETDGTMHVGHNCGAQCMFYRSDAQDSWKCSCRWVFDRTEERWPGPLITIPHGPTVLFQNWLAWWMDVDPETVEVRIR